jgi:hypothetical protein
VREKMKNYKNSKIVYSINLSDIQEVAQQVIDRKLNKYEIVKVKESIGDYLDWFAAIENSIQEHIPYKETELNG